MATGDSKEITPKDKKTGKTLIHEHIPLTGSLISGTYVVSDADENVKNYSHGMFQSVYDYPYLSSSANHIFDVTCGFSAHSSFSASTPGTQQEKKINIYNQMAQVLAGYDHTGSILRFDVGGSTIDSGDKMDEVYFLNFSRLLVKDEIKKGTFQLELGISGGFDFGAVHSRRIKLTDRSGSDGYKVNSPAGEYGVLFAQTSYDGDSTLSTALLGNETIGEVQSYLPAGLIYYQAGVAVISGSVFGGASSSLGAGAFFNGAGNDGGQAICELGSGLSASGVQMFTGSTIQAACDGLRNRIYNIQFNNTTELNSAIYFCRVNHNEFNYSSNPTYVSGGQINVKNNSDDISTTYITTVGLFNAQNEMLAVAKLSEPLKKTPEDELTIRVRLDY